MFNIFMYKFTCVGLTLSYLYPRHAVENRNFHKQGIWKFYWNWKELGPKLAWVFLSHAVRPGVWNHKHFNFIQDCRAPSTPAKFSLQQQQYKDNILILLCVTRYLCQKAVVYARFTVLVVIHSSADVSEMYVWVAKKPKCCSVQR